jgi:hypothetical protein
MAGVSGYGGGISEVINATVASGASLSGVIGLNGCLPTGLVIPSNFDGTQITFQVSADGTTYQVLWCNGALLTLTVAASVSYTLKPEDFIGWRYLKVATVTQQATSDTVIGVLVTGL